MGPALNGTKVGAPGHGFFAKPVNDEAKGFAQLVLGGRTCWVMTSEEPAEQVVLSLAPNAQLTHAKSDLVAIRLLKGRVKGNVLVKGSRSSERQLSLNLH